MFLKNRTQTLKVEARLPHHQTEQRDDSKSNLFKNLKELRSEYNLKEINS